MTGTVDDCNVDAALTRRASDQTSLYAYESDPNEEFVGIVHSPNEELRAACDRTDGRLAPDEELFSDWINERDRLRAEGLSPTQAHNRAFDSVNYRKRFVDDLDLAAIEDYVMQIESGRNIVLVCYCANGRQCHRRIVKEKIHERL